MVLYVLVCGKVPFDDQSMPALHAKIKRGLVEYPAWLSAGAWIDTNRCRRSTDDSVAECKHILSRMLVTNPQLRSSLPDLLNHPWMTRGFNGSPDPHLLRREPLRADELDRQVIRNMTGFEFGTEEDIERRLVAILESESYRRAVQYWESKRERPRIWNDSLSNSSLAIAWDGATGMVGGGGNKADVPSTPKKNKRFSGFDFYRRKLFSPSTSPPPSPFASPSPSQSQLSNPSLSDVNQKEPPDPTRGYNPLLSIYYLAREKMERDRVYGTGHFASSQLSMNPPQPAPEEAPPPSASKQAVQLTVPTSGTPQKPTGGADYNMRPSRLPAPESMHYSKMSYDLPVTPSPTAPTFQQRQQQQPQPRARDAGLPVPKHVDLTPPSPSPITVPGGPESATGAATPTGPASATLPRAPPASTHRRSHSVSQRQGVPRGLASMFGGGGAGATGGVNEHGQLRVNVSPNINGLERPRTAGPELTTFAERVEDDEQATLTPGTPRSPPPEVVLSPATPPVSAGSTLVRRFGNLLVGGGSIRGSGDRAGKRTSILGSFGSPRPSADMDQGDRRVTSSPPNEKRERASTSAPTSPSAGEATVVAAEDEGKVEMHVTPTGGISHSQTQPLHRRAATILDPQGHAKRHERRSSTGGALLSSVGGTIGRHRRPSTSQAGGRPSQLDRERLFGQTAEVPEEGDGSGRPSGQARVNGAGYELTDGEDETNANAADKDFKPVFLKGLFRYVRDCSLHPVTQVIISFYSVATTSTKPPAVLKTDIRRVLDRMQVQYRETKTGFDCIHLPSIDISSLQDPHGTPTPSPRKHRKQGSGGSGDSGGTTRRIVRKASKLSFGMNRKDKDKDRTGESSVNGSTHREKDKELPGRPSGGAGPGPGPGPTTNTFGATQSSGSSSFFNVSSNAPTVQPDDASATLQPDEDSPGRRSHSPARTKTLPPIPRDFVAAGAATPQQQQQQQPVSPPPTGEVADPEVFESVGRNTLSVRFEINIVKVRLLSHFVEPPQGGPDSDSDFYRSHGCRYMVSNSAGQAEMDGSTRCSHVEF